MKKLLVNVSFLIISQYQNISYSSNDSDFDFGDLKVRCACDNEENHISSVKGQEGTWYKKVELLPPPRFSLEQLLQKIKLHNIAIKNEQLEGAWYEKAGLPPPPGSNL